MQHYDLDLTTVTARVDGRNLPSKDDLLLCLPHASNRFRLLFRLAGEQQTGPKLIRER